MQTVETRLGKERTRQTSASAVLRGAKARLRIDLLGYEFPDAVEGFDADWLVVRCTLVRGLDELECEGPYLLADELAAWAAWTPAVERVVGATTLAFTEPNLVFGWSARQPNDRRAVHVRLLREHRTWHTSMEATLDVPQSALLEFGTALTALAQKFPVRSRRLDADRIS